MIIINSSSKNINFIGNAVIGLHNKDGVILLNNNQDIINFKNNTIWSESGNEQYIVKDINEDAVLNFRLNLISVRGSVYGDCLGIKDHNVYMVAAGSAPLSEIKSRSNPFEDVFFKKIKLTTELDVSDIIPYKGIAKDLSKIKDDDYRFGLDVTCAVTPTQLWAGCIQGNKESGKIAVESFRWIPYWVSDCAMPDYIKTLNLYNSPNRNVKYVGDMPKLIVAKLINRYNTFPGISTYDLVLTLDRHSSDEVYVNWHTEAGTAVENVHFVPGSGTAVFAPFEIEKTIPSIIIGDLNDFLDDGLSDPPVNFWIRYDSDTVEMINDTESIIQDSIRYETVYTGGPTRDPKTSQDIYFNNGENIVPGKYMIIYKGGGLNYSNQFRSNPGAPHFTFAFFIATGVGYGAWIVTGNKGYLFGTYPSGENSIYRSVATAGQTKISCNVPGNKIPSASCFLDVYPQRSLETFILKKNNVNLSRPANYSLENTTTPGYITINFTTPLSEGDVIEAYGYLYYQGWMYHYATLNGTRNVICNAIPGNNYPAIKWLDGMTSYSVDVYVNSTRKNSSTYTVANNNGILEIIFNDNTTGYVEIKNKNPTIVDPPRTSWEYIDNPMYLELEKQARGMIRIFNHEGGTIYIRQGDSYYSDNWGLGIGFQLLGMFDPGVITPPPE